MKGYFARLIGVGSLLVGLAAVVGEQGSAADDSAGSGQSAASSSLVGVETPAEGAAAVGDKAGPTPMAGTTTVGDKAGPAPAAEPAAAPDTQTAASICIAEGPGGVPGQIWFRSEYLHMWTRGDRIPVLASTTPDNSAASLPGTTAYGDRTILNGDHDGFRIALGMWLDPCHTWGLEAEYFDLGRAHDNYDSGVQNGYPFLLRPSTDSGGVLSANNYVGSQTDRDPRNLFPLSASTAGSVAVQSDDYFQSVGVSLRRSLWSADWSSDWQAVAWLDRNAHTIQIDGLLGYRFYRLADNLLIHEQKVGTGSANEGQTIDVRDSFQGDNSFQGVDLGVSTLVTRGRWSVNMAGRLSLGDNRQAVNIAGQTTTVDSNGAAFPLGPGLLANAGNSGLHVHDEFAAVPHFNAEIGYQVTNYWKIFAGYEAVYWNNVVRAGEEITSFGGLPVINAGGTTPFIWNTTSYWAQGVRLGAEVRY